MSNIRRSRLSLDGCVLAACRNAGFIAPDADPSELVNAFVEALYSLEQRKWPSSDCSQFFDRCVAAIDAKRIALSSVVFANTGKTRPTFSACTTYPEFRIGSSDDRKRFIELHRLGVGIGHAVPPSQDPVSYVRRLNDLLHQAHISVTESRTAGDIVLLGADHPGEQNARGRGTRFLAGRSLRITSGRRFGLDFWVFPLCV